MPEEGLPAKCVATMDALLAFPKAMLVRRLGTIGPARIGEVCDSWRAAVESLGESELTERGLTVLAEERRSHGTSSVSSRLLRTHSSCTSS